MTAPPSPLVDGVREFLQVLVRGVTQDLKTNEPFAEPGGIGGLEPITAERPSSNYSVEKLRERPSPGGV
jgi:hypothetical protein